VLVVVFVVTFVPGIEVVVFEVVVLVEDVVLAVVLVEVWSILRTTGVNSWQA